MSLRINQTVAYTNSGGLWVIKKRIRLVGNECQRYDIKNKKTGEELFNVRDKDLRVKGDKFFEVYSNM